MQPTTESATSVTYRESFLKKNFKKIFMFIFLFLLSIINIAAILTIFPMYFRDLLSAHSQTHIRILSAFLLCSSFVLNILFFIKSLFLLRILIKQFSKPYYILHDDRIEIKPIKKMGETILFSDIQEFYKFGEITKTTAFPHGASNHLAFRKSASDNWNVLSYNLKASRKLLKDTSLIDEFARKYAAYNKNKIIDDLENKKLVRFTYLSEEDGKNKNLFDANLFKLTKSKLSKGNSEKLKKYFNGNGSELILDRTGIILDKEKVLFKDGDKLIFKEHKVNFGIGKKFKNFSKGKLLEIRSESDELKLEIDLVFLINSDLFADVITDIYENKIFSDDYLQYKTPVILEKEDLTEIKEIKDVSESDETSEISEVTVESELDSFVFENAEIEEITESEIIENVENEIKELNVSESDKKISSGDNSLDEYIFSSSDESK